MYPLDKPLGPGGDVEVIGQPLPALGGHVPHHPGPRPGGPRATAAHLPPRGL